MLKLTLSLANWSNGVFVIGVFALVCIGLVVMLLLFLRGGKKK